MTWYASSTENREKFESGSCAVLKLGDGSLHALTLRGFIEPTHILLQPERIGT